MAVGAVDAVEPWGPKKVALRLDDVGRAAAAAVAAE
ncbi:hypothetical protein N181_24180 [Sinorhizobium fredii USDA 205]|nr:hypothetical protein N181_24180 [Sinorhizobium fredii USDA 205]